MRFNRIFLLFVIMVFLAACGSATDPVETSTAPEEIETSVPATEEALVEPTEADTYPPPAEMLPTSDVYPAPIETEEYNPYPEPGEDFEGTPFALNKPLYAGDTQISGSGPAGVPIFIADVTFGGEPIAQGVIGADGTFTFLVSALESGHRLGIALGDLDGTDFNADELLQSGYLGEGALTVPTIGFFLDTAPVLEK